MQTGDRERKEPQNKTVSVLGSTGSIGTQSLQVCAAQGYRVAALAAHSNVKLLAEQARRFRPALAVVSDPDRYGDLKIALADTGVEPAAGPEEVCRAAAFPAVDVTMNSIVGIAGLRPTLAALEAGKDVALSNKETLVTGGELVMEAARRNGVSILPVDSEHSAIWQCLRSGRREELQSLILTASGGPFFGKRREELEGVTVEQALAHPNWSMGAKITVDSATLMNKGLEFIEAMWLFGVEPSRIQVVVHRQSVIHSAVEFCDGAVIAQMGVPDMRAAIQYALTYPRRTPLEGGERLSLLDYGSLTFQEPDPGVFTCLSVCMDAARRGGLAPCLANGANEAAVALFLQGDIGFLRIGELVGEASGLSAPGAVTLEAVEQADRLARDYVASKVNG